MKKSYLFLLASAVLALSACGDTTSNTTTGTNTDETTQTTQDNTSSSSSNDTTTSNPVTYRVMVNAATGVTAHVDKEYAEPGEIVTLTIDEVKPGYSINQVLLNSKTVLTSSDGINYPFEMPDGSASISFSVSVEGSTKHNYMSRLYYNMTPVGGVPTPLQKDAASANIRLVKAFQLFGRNNCREGFKLQIIALSLQKIKTQDHGNA